MKDSTLLFAKAMTTSIVLVAATSFTACSSKPTAVNEVAQSPITPMSRLLPADQDPTDTNKNPQNLPIVAAIQGQVLVQAGTLPSPANRAKVQLFQIKNSKETQLTETTTASDGTFTFTRKLLPGDYLIKVKGKNITAEQKFTLDNKPLQNLTIEAKEISKK